eukprot:scaffold4886_cov123-Isochrysis_galbana.AAC.12
MCAGTRSPARGPSSRQCSKSTPRVTSDEQETQSEAARQHHTTPIKHTRITRRKEGREDERRTRKGPDRGLAGFTMDNFTVRVSRMERSVLWPGWWILCVVGGCTKGAHTRLTHKARG